jgi:putative hemin transport protein
MSLTRNDACILEHKGSFQKVNIFEAGDHFIGTVIGPIETRIFYKNWHVAFAVRQEKKGKILQSIQVFDKAGDAITKIYLQKKHKRKSNEVAYHQIIEDFRSPNQGPEQPVIPYSDEVFSSDVDQEAFLEDWGSLRDTHDFFPMLRKHKIHRFHALELAVEKYTYQIQPEAVQTILEEAAATQLPIMIFAGKRGTLQIHQGKVRTIRMLERVTPDRGHTGAEKWLNVLDPDFNMHLRMDQVDTAWVVKKPTADGIVTAIELFDTQKNLIAQFFGLRKPGIPQKETWAQLVAALPKLE